MGMLSSLLSIIAVSAVVYHFSGCCFSEDQKPPPERDGWFGRGDRKPETDESIRPFQVKVSDKDLEDLQARLKNVRLGEDLEDTQFQYGFQVKYMKEVIKHWKTSFDWRKQETEINKFPQFKTKIEGIDVHFVHVKPAKQSGKKRVLLMSHGWPGSVWEFYKIIPMLTDPAAYGGREEDAFEVICPSIPGYGFSEAPHKTGFNVLATARIYRKLMARLGHTKFYIQGGDWGGLIFSVMSQVYPQNVMGAHLNMFTNRVQHAPTFIKNVIANYFPSLMGLSEEDYAKAYPLSKLFIKLMKALGYMHLQATKPDTVAFALNDSPVGLAAYILEKFSGWTQGDFENLPDGGLTKKFTLDDLLTNVMIYWTTGTVGSSMRFYKENFGSEEIMSLDGIPIDVPVGLADFPNEMARVPQAMLTSRFRNIVQYTTFPAGGHFAAMEEPRLLADDIFLFVSKVEKR